MRELFESEGPVSLAVRLDDLMIRLDQEGRERDARLVHEAIEALPKAVVVGTPWTSPLLGDRCVRQDGKSREAVSVTYRQDWPADRRKPQTVKESTEGYHVDLIRYRDQKGREYTISASSWATWCRAACRAGGAYTRAEAQS